VSAQGKTATPCALYQLQLARRALDVALGEFSFTDEEREARWNIDHALAHVNELIAAIREGRPYAPANSIRAAQHGFRNLLFVAEEKADREEREGVGA
jgi:hypothetical protein